jgi:hypothetical protein
LSYVIAIFTLNMRDRITKKKSRAKTQSRRKATKKTNPLGNVTIRSKKAKGRGGFLSEIGERAGAFLGRAGADALGKVFGLGEYHVKSNTITNPNNPPILSNTTSGTRIQHREYLGDIRSTTGFTNQVFPLNPGIPTTFPWLAGIAQYFEQYKLWGALIEFKSTSAVALNSTSTGLGTVIIATEYDVTKPAFQDKRSMENYMYCTTAPPSVSMLHPVECARDVNVLNTLYVRSASQTTSSDLRFSDLGNVNVATVGMPAAGSNIGELWITYDVELLKPRLAPSISSNVPTHYTYDSVLYNTAGAPTAANFFADSTGKSKFTLRGVGNSAIGPLTSNTLSFYSTGTYKVDVYAIGGGVSLGAISVAIASGTAVGDGTFVTTYYTQGGGTLGYNVQFPPAGITNNAVMFSFVINVTLANLAQPCQVSYTFGTLPSSIIGGDLTITTLPTGFTEPEFEPAQLDSLRRAMKLLELDEKSWVNLAEATSTQRQLDLPKRSLW